MLPPSVLAWSLSSLAQLAPNTSMHVPLQTFPWIGLPYVSEQALLDTPSTVTLADIARDISEEELLGTESPWARYPADSTLFEHNDERVRRKVHSRYR